MDKITIERETLEALELMLGDFCVSGRATDATRALSRKVAAALAAQPAEPVAQPYAWHYTNNGGASVWHMGPSNRLDADISASAKFPKVHKVTPVYAAQSDPAAVPLTKEQRELFDLILHHYGPDKRLQPLRDLIAAAGDKP